MSDNFLECLRCSSFKFWFGFDSLFNWHRGWQSPLFFSIEDIEASCLEEFSLGRFGYYASAELIVV